MRDLFGTRADLVLVLVLALQLAVPVVMRWSFRQARERRFVIHRRAQLALLALCFAAVFALEIHIRTAGGSGRLVAGSPFAGTALFRAVFSLHVGGALLTYLLWAGLAWASVPRFGRALPGAFSRRHRRLGKVVFGGLCFTAVSATAMFVIGFVL
jgi:putative membrane protein